MSPFPDKIIEFLHSNHVLSLATCHNSEVWSASCFYVFDECEGRLIILTSNKSKHSQFMQYNPMISGTIAGQPLNIRDIRGIQLTACAQCLNDKVEHKNALKLYIKAHPIAKLIPSNIWSLKLETIKHTDNQLLFAKKIYWQRN